MKMDSFVRTVTGDIDPKKLGFCHCHEHLLIAYGASALVDPNLLLDSEDLSAEELKNYKEAGGCSVVDAQPTGCGRIELGLKRLALKSSVNIIASTGFHMRRFYPEVHWIFRLSSKDAANIFIHEINDGMFVESDDRVPKNICDVRAGIIKTALDKPDNFFMYKGLFTGAVLAASQTGVPIMVHVEKGADVPAFLRFLEEAGAGGIKVIFCHMDRSVPDREIHAMVCRKGWFLEYDTIARYKYHDDKTEIGIISEMVREGFEDSILLGLDSTRTRLSSYGGTPGLSFISKEFIGMMQAVGMKDGIIQKFMVSNPAKALSFKSVG